MHGFMIAAPQSGSGKTTVSLAIMAAFRRRGLKVAPFKCGPDFIDPGYHRLASGQPSVNLDAWMCPEEFVRETFCHHAVGADIAVVEAVMGLFDGIGASPMSGSSAQIAAITRTPVVLVLNARGMSASAAALVKGFAEFDPSVRLAGVIFNNVGSQNHADLLAEAVRTALPGIGLFGFIPRDEKVAIPSRHLGLVTVEDNPLLPEYFDALADLAEAYLDLDGLAVLETGALLQPVAENSMDGNRVRIAVASDAAFCFVYQDNLRLLTQAGAEVVPFSPLNDSALPEGIGGIYLPGGYPELYAERLAANSGMLAAVRDAVDAGMPVYAECGGFVYLTRGMTNPEGDGADFVGIYPLRARMLDRRKALGYRQAELTSDCLIGRAGEVVRGHEFHYSEIVALPDDLRTLYRVSRQGKDLGGEGYAVNNCLASYLHLHFGSNPRIAVTFVAACRGFGELKNRRG